jgi:hypothetical protein
MCMAVCHQFGERLAITYFHDEKALLPVKLKHSDNVVLLPWGRRKKEKSKLPLGGWASLDTLKENNFAQYFPKPVKIMVRKFLECDIENHPYWFDVTQGQWIQGVLLQDKDEMRVYILTFKPNMPDNPFPRWPKINCL